MIKQLKEEDVNFLTITFGDNDYQTIFYVLLSLLKDYTIKETMVQHHNNGKLREFIDKMLIMARELCGVVDTIPNFYVDKNLNTYKVHLTKRPVESYSSVILVIDYSTNNSYVTVS